MQRHWGAALFVLGSDREEAAFVARDQRVENLEQFLAQRGQALLRTAVLLTGSIEAGEDLLQSAIERLLRQGRRFHGDPEGYLRRTVCNLAIDSYRRQGRWRRKLLLLSTETHAPADATAEVDLRDALVRLLVQLPPQQRTVLVLRYWEQLNGAETAELLGCSEDAVKSAASRGLRRLRELADSMQHSGAQLHDMTARTTKEES
jgi:RNA polymerase sigma-70 factor (sigma-E family)